MQTAGGALAAAKLLTGRSVVPRGAIVLAYHDVCPSPTTGYTVPPDLFRQHLSWARGWGARFVPLSDLVSGFLDGAPIDGLVAVAFDDALAGVYRYGAPILRELGVPATVFVVSECLGRPPEWWPGSDRTMTAEELSSLLDDGHAIGSHTRTHRLLRGLEPPDLEAEVHGSRHALEALFGGTVDLLAYPEGHFDPIVVDSVRRAGYRAAFTFLNGRVELGLDRYRLPRLNMWDGQHRARLAYHLARPAGSWGDVGVDAFG